MIGFPLQLPIEATTPRHMKLVTEFFGHQANTGESLGVAMICIALNSQAEITAATEWMLRRLAETDAVTP